LVSVAGCQDRDLNLVRCIRPGIATLKAIFFFDDASREQEGGTDERHRLPPS
jgi:hypothetical protein